MKKLLSIIVLGLLFSGCSDSGANKLYLKCKTIKAGTLVTGDYGTEIDEIKYFEIDLKTKKVKSNWDEFNGKFKWNRTLLSVGEKYIQIKDVGTGVRGTDHARIDRGTGKMTHYKILDREAQKTPISMCEKINKKGLLIKKVDKKF